MKNRIAFFFILLMISVGIYAQKIMKIGIIGLDTSHSTAFTELINSGSDETFSQGFRVVAAYPYGSKTIQSSYERIPGYIEKVKTQGVKIVSSIADLLDKVDCILLETNDGRLHLEQAMEVFKAGKICYIDKPIGATLGDAIAIYEMAEKYDIPIFSSSALRFTPQNQKLRNDELGKILGADCYSPHKVEPTHPDFGFYGIHGVETLYTVMGTGCESDVYKRQSILPDVISRAPELAPVYLKPNETLKLHIFIDKSIIEIFVNDKQVVTTRVYPGKKESVGISLKSQGRDATLISMDVWQMKSIYKELQNDFIK